MADTNNLPNAFASEDWQEIVDNAQFLLLIQSARDCGLIANGPEIDEKRCEYILKLGADLGYNPHSTPELVKKYLLVAKGAA
jgi:hypothetical protein